jgi:hypothetical protein
MERRSFLKATAGAAAFSATAGIAAPAVAQGAAARTLRFVPQANLANFDPIWGTQYVVRNAALLVWDTLYGVDEACSPQRQMVESARGLGRWPDLDLQAAPRPEIPRQRPRPGQGRGGQPDALGRARPDGADAPRPAERAGGGE